MMRTNHKIIFGDTREEIKKIGDQSIELIITSPPYFNRKDYNHQRQIGYNQTYEEYIESLDQIWRECFQILNYGCKLCINIGDIYSNTKENGRYFHISIKTDIINSCKNIGFDLYSTIIWEKISRCHPSGGCNLMGSIYYPRNGIVKENFEYILIFKKGGKDPKVSKKIKEKSRISLKDWTTYFNGIWKIQGTLNNEHIATFPLEIPYRLIRMYSFVGDTILDPFLGSGTTIKASKILKRNSIGIELNKQDYWPIIQKKISFNNFGLMNEYKYQIIDGEKCIKK